PILRSIDAASHTLINLYIDHNHVLTDAYAPLERPVESLVRQQIRRGTVYVNVQIDREPRPDDYRLNETVLTGYLKQLESAVGKPVPRDVAQLAPLLSLPGVVHEPHAEFEEIESQWPKIEGVVSAALEHLAQMRTDEGRRMATDLTTNARAIAAGLKKVEARAPLVIDAYRGRLS